MTPATLARARAGDEEAFRELTDPYRRELQLHCYRLLGSVQDAEDLLQETLLAAWRGLEDFEQRASLRSWLYRIATNRCLNALRDSGRRPRGVPLNPPDFPAPTFVSEPMWLEPYPDVLLEGIPELAPGPEARYESKEALGLAFVAGLQHLPPLQRAVLVLREVLGFRAAEVAEMLETSPAAVNSALQRARGVLEERPVPARERALVPRSARERELVDRFADAFQAGDIETLVTLLTDDALLTMPPEPLAYQGRDAVGEFLLGRISGRDGREARLVPTRANGQPALAYYLQDPQCALARLGGLLVLTVVDEGVRAITRFRDTAILPYFGLPRTLR